MPFRQRAAATTRAGDRADDDVRAIADVAKALGTATDAAAVATAALKAVRTAFGWAYGSYWQIDHGQRALRFAVESGDAGDEFRAVTQQASFAEGVGLSGRAWRSRDLVFVADLAEVTDCVRAPAARKVGVKSGVCFPITVAGQVVGTMDFFATETLNPSPSRLQALRTVGRLLSSAMERMVETAASAQAATQLITSIREISSGASRASAAAAEAVHRVAVARDTVAGLGASSGEIGSVVETITSIADQIETEQQPPHRRASVITHRSTVDATCRSFGW
ncbi:GAF domain-containing protein [Actinoplanes xinjiangensis]|uniref:GAF domain-containing protein n=1 Tax=Actinoplanes xinjiangensis TaxID=512350 RepID=UPI003444666C